MKQQTRNELFLIAAIILIAAIFYAGNHLAARQPSAIVEVSVDGTVTHEFPLDLETEFTIQGYDGGKNHLIIKNGTAEISEASCPDKICVNHAPINASGQTIVCLPNRLVVTIK